MANSTGGYECEFVEKPQKAFQSECPVCLLVLQDPYQVTCCGYAFCQVCIQKVKQDNKLCPCCNSKDFDKFEDKRLKRSLFEFKVNCTNKKQGCQWMGELGTLDDHLNSNPVQQKQMDGCQFMNIKCQYCPELFQRSVIELHQKSACPKRPFSCKCCKKFESTYEDVTTNHWPVCGHYPVQCTNKCGKTIKRQHLESHISNNCPLTVIDCEFSHVDCEVKLPRKDMVEHVRESVIKHLSLHAAKYKADIDELKEQNKQLKQQLAKMTQLEKQVAQLTQYLNLQQIYTPICPAVFTMTDFEQHKKDDDGWYSPPFYTHPKGYKMSVVVDANGNDDYEGTHTSVGVTLMRGEFDDQLTWPFRGCITIRLLSQKDEDYKESVFPFKSTGRVLTEGEDMAAEAPSFFNFISHTDLRPKYLKNDCIKLRAYEYTPLEQ